MKNKELIQIIAFCKPYYQKTGKWHGWDHITGVRNHAKNIASTEFPDTNISCVDAAAIIHDIGRAVRDEGHAEESGRIIEPFLKSIKISSTERTIILDAVVHHDVKKILKSKTVEARIMYDADKIEILTVYGFMRVCYWLVEERDMEIGKAVNFLWSYCQKFEATLYSDYAKHIIHDEMKLLKEMIGKFNTYKDTYRA